MLRSPFKRARGQVSYLALAMIAILMTFALGQCHNVLLCFKRDGSYPSGLRKDLILVNAPHLVRIQKSAGSGEVLFEQERCAYTWKRDQTDLLNLDRIEIVFPDHPKWPRLCGLWLAGGNFNIYLIDHRAR